MIVIIAPEKNVVNEITILNQLFEAGLEYYHLRKPEKNRKEYCAYLNQIDEKYHPRIVVHYFHELVNDYNLKGIHFKEQKRRDYLDVPGAYFKDLNLYGKTISSSFHEIEELEKCDFEFDYHFLSPVFTSISKIGYEGRTFDVNDSDKIIIGLGGVTAKNSEEFSKLGFKGIAVLGGIWNSTTPISNFKKIRNNFIKAKINI
jgi:thiamine-phosphate pyrophosphorylase